MLRNTMGSGAAALLLLLGGALAYQPSAAMAAAFANGGFESPQVTGSYESSMTDAWSLTNAHVTNASTLNSGSGGNTTTADGTQFATLNANGSAGSVSQTFQTVAGQQYQVTFYQNQFYDDTGTYNPQPTSVTLTATAPGFSQDYTYSRGSVNNTFATDPTWTQRSFQFTASDTTSTLTFAGDTNSALDFGQAIDAVSVAQTPEPALTLIAGISVTGLLFRRRR